MRQIRELVVVSCLLFLCGSAARADTRSSWGPSGVGARRSFERLLKAAGRPDLRSRLSGVFQGEGAQALLAGGPRDITGNGELLWTREAGEAYADVAICDLLGTAFAAAGAPGSRVEMIPVEGGGELEWSCPGTDYVAVAAAREADLFAALDVDDAAGTVCLRVWTRADSLPDWSVTFPGVSTSLVKSLAISANGSRIAVLLGPDDGSVCQMKVYSAGGSLLRSDENSGFGVNLAITEDGRYVFYSSLTDIATGRLVVYNTVTGARIWSNFALLTLVGGMGLQISADGNKLVYDEIDILLMRGKVVVRAWLAGMYLVRCSHNEGQMMATAISADPALGSILTGWASTDTLNPQPSKLVCLDANCGVDGQRILPAGLDPLWCAVTADGGHVVVGLQDSGAGASDRMTIYTLPTLQEAYSLETSTGPWPVAIVSCGGAVYAAGCDGSRLHMTRKTEQLLTVRPDGTGSYPSIQAAINAAAGGAVIELADGVFTGTSNRNLDFGGRAITLRSASGDPELCVIDCQNAMNARGARFHTGERWCSVLRGVTIRNGFVQMAMPPLRGGAGIRCEAGTSPTLHRCVVENGTASPGGGGISCEGASPLISRCGILDNHAFSGGGILCTSGAAPWIHGCLIAGNTGTSQGGGLFDSTATPRLTSCTIADNVAGSGVGGGIYSGASSQVSLRNTIVAFNTGRGVHCRSDGSAILSCCDVYGNTQGNWVGCLAGQDANGGNISEDPLFCSREAPLYTIEPASPCAPDQQPECGLIGSEPDGCIPLPDLVVVAVDPDSVTEGQAVWVIIRVGNQGNAAAEASHTRIRVDGAVACSEIATPALNALEETTLDCNLGVLPVGEHSVEACADISAEVIEADGPNNCRTEPLLVKRVDGVGDDPVRAETGILAIQPNPASRMVSIGYAVARSGPVRIEIFDVSGRCVRVMREGPARAGVEIVVWDGRTAAGEHAPSGLYWVQMSAEGTSWRRHLVLLR